MPYRPSLVSPTLRPVLRPLVQQVFGYFDPLKLDPYLYFDTRESMVGTLENPTLDLDPSKPETLDVITATRSGTATYTDANGNIATAAADTVRVDYTQGEELTPTKFQNIGYTDFANSYWIARGFTKVGTVDGPLGYTGYEFLENNSNSNPAVYVNSDLSDGSPMTFGVWLKASSPVSIALATTGSVRTSTINVTTEWQFFSCADNINTNTGPHIGGFATITQGSGVTLFAAMPQLEEGTTASDFVSNTTGSPKFIASATYGPRVPMILVEPSATNLVTYSEDFSQSSWDKQSGGTGVAPAITSNDTIAPDGTQSADKVVFNKGAADDPSNYSILSDAFPSQQNTASLFIKADTNQRIVIRNSNSWVAYDVTTEWTRIEQTDTGGSLQIGLRDGYGIPNVPDTATVYLWGAQVEAGSVATSYIPTSGSTVLRQADDLEISGSAFSDFYNQSEGTWYCEAVPKGNDGSENYTFILEFGTDSANRVGFFYYVADGSLSVTGFNSNSQYYNQTKLGDSTNQLARLSYSYESGNHKSAINGTSDSDTDTVVPPANQLKLGKRIVGTNGSLVGHLKRVLFWPYHSDRL